MQETLREWLKYKAERRESYKPTGLKKLSAEVKGKLSLYQETAVISLIDECMANGWRGIIWDKLNKKGGFSNVRKSAPVSYTHLDVYKRQGVLRVNASILF